MWRLHPPNRSGAVKEPSAIEAGEPAYRRIALGLPGHAGEDKHPLDPSHANRVHFPTGFTKAIYDTLSPGATLLVTDAPALKEKTTAVAPNVMNADAPRVD